MELATVSNDWMCNLTGAFGEPYETCFKLSERWRHVCSDSHMILILPHSGLHLYECWWIPKVMPHQVVKEASGQEPGCQQHGSGWGAVGLFSCGTAYHSSHWTSKGGQTDLKCKQVVPDKALSHCLIASGFCFFFKCIHICQYFLTTILLFGCKFCDISTISLCPLLSQGLVLVFCP